MEIKTLEQLFIREYEQLEIKNEALKDENEALKEKLTLAQRNMESMDKLCKKLLDSLELKANDLTEKDVWTGRSFVRKDKDEVLYSLLAGYIVAKFGKEMRKKNNG